MHQSLTSSMSLLFTCIALIKILNRRLLNISLKYARHLAGSELISNTITVYKSNVNK